ncbi:hypothetical protein CEK62_20390 (plasmid) [Alcanivorax sp. N3-2A]|nr:hypothetical protein CEK62_00200 [Alcanivorax sp. N3-2A]ASK36729.1 hypothetical protein CEK62_20390 [Alcanivorax sp. N3-2A]
MKRCITLMSMAFLAIAFQAHAEREDGSACVTVEVDGYRALPYHCLQQKMAPLQAPERNDDAALDSADVTRLAPNRIGQFSQSALRNRMGNALGKGVRPQRLSP